MSGQSSGAVFLSYASQDAEAARRICDGLQAAGVEVWLDQSELVGGDAWDVEIRRRIKECTLFVPVISANTEQRREGYFRLEWRLADQRTHMMAKGTPFLVPVVIDATRDDRAHVPDSFVEVQWTRLSGGDGGEAFARRVRSLLVAADTQAEEPAVGAAPIASPPARWRVGGLEVAILAVLLVIAGTLLWAFSGTRAGPNAPSAATAAAPAARTAVAVLPFVNLNQDEQGDTLSLGIPEALLHQLASLPDLTVIARTSSFSFRGKQSDIREIGTSLNARYLIEGSVQKGEQSLRVTAQLIDASDGSHVWSMQFDRKPEDLLTLQDEIAREVSRALENSVDKVARPVAALARSHNFDANLEFMQANTLLASWRLPDMQASVEHALRALRLDPAFAAAYVTLAQGLVRTAEFAATPERTQKFAESLEHGLSLVNKALSLDPNSAEAYFQRAYLTAFRDLPAAEADYRHGLTLAPNSPAGLEGLAVVLHEDRARRTEALELMDRARKLDPLEPRLDVVKAAMLQYGKADFDGAERLVRHALDLNPVYSPAIFRMQEIRMVQGQFAEGIRFGEQVISLDAGNEQARTMLQMLYMDVMDSAAVKRLAGAQGQARPVARMLQYIDQQQWAQASADFFEADAKGLLSPLCEVIAVLAVRMNARAGRDVQRAIEVLTRRGGVTWSSSGEPSINDPGGQWANAVALGDLLMLAGKMEQGRRLLTTIVADVRREVDAGRSAAQWSMHTEPIALALLGQNDAAMRILSDAGLRSRRFNAWRPKLLMEPAFAGLRSDPRFQQLIADMRAHAEAEKVKLQAMRNAGLVPAQ